jgi:hypothetical protein
MLENLSWHVSMSYSIAQKSGIYLFAKTGACGLLGASSTIVVSRKYQAA